MINYKGLRLEESVVKVNVDGETREKRVKLGLLTSSQTGVASNKDVVSGIKSSVN